MTRHVKDQLTGFAIFAVIVLAIGFGLSILMSNRESKEAHIKAMWHMEMNANNYFLSREEPDYKTLYDLISESKDEQIRCYAVSQLAFFNRKFSLMRPSQEHEGIIRSCISKSKHLDITDMVDPRLKPWETVK